MRILIIAVTYNSYQCLEPYIKSVDEAAARSNAEITIAIADNTPADKLHPIELKPDHCTLITLQSRLNLGYWGGVEKMIDHIGKDTVDEYDYTLVTNVDVTVDNDFFIQLTALDSKGVGWYAPAIVSEYEGGRDKNPRLMKRYERKRLEVLLFLFRFPILHWLYHNTLYRRKRLKAATKPMSKVYAGHGSFMVFTGEFIRTLTDYHYPSFLFCEEIFIAEHVAAAGLNVIYAPQLKVMDKEHVSTFVMPRMQFYKYNAQSVSYILNEFYAQHDNRQVCRNNMSVQQ